MTTATDDLLPEAGAPDVLYLLDLHCWMHRFWATVQGRCAHCFLEFVNRLLRDYQPAYFAVCKDMPHPTFRHELAPTIYKATREPPDPTFLERLRWAAEMLTDVHGIPVYGVRGFEADDLLAALTKQAKDAGMRVVIIGLDKDLMQLVDDRCVMWDGKRNVVGPAQVEAKFGVRPDQLRDYLAIVGDVSDHVPGVTGMGPKAAAEILAEFGTLDAALEVAAYPYDRPFWQTRPSYRKMLKAQRAQALLSKELVTLAFHAPVTFNRTELQR